MNPPKADPHFGRNCLRPLPAGTVQAPGGAVAVPGSGPTPRPVSCQPDKRDSESRASITDGKARLTCRPPAIP